MRSLHAEKEKITFYHSIFDTKTNNITKINTSNVKIHHLSHLGSIYLKTKKIILLITSNSVYSCNIMLNKWSNLNIKYPEDHESSQDQFG